MVEKRTTQNSKYIVVAFMSVILFVITYKYTLNLVKFNGINDMREHMWHAESIYSNNFFEKWLERPYFLWHILVKASALYLGMPMIEATSFVCGVMSAFTCLVTFFVLERFAMEKAKCFAGNAAACAAGGLLVLIEWIQDIILKKADHKKTLIFIRNLILSSIPAMIYLLSEYTAYYVLDTMNDDAGIGIYSAFYVWDDFTTNIPISILLAMAFPLYMVLTNLKYFLKEVEGKLALLAYVVGTLELSFTQ